MEDGEILGPNERQDIYIEEGGEGGEWRVERFYHSWTD